jgi:integrase/recombinase XerD
MNQLQEQHYNFLYEQHLINLRLQGKRPSTIDAYARAVRRITAFFDKTPDTLTMADLKQYFNSLIQTHSWSTIKLDRNGLQFFYRYTLNKQWEWLSIVKPPQVKRLPDIITPRQVTCVINKTKQLRYKVFFLTLYSLGLRLSEGLNLTIRDIDGETMQVHLRNAKGGKDRIVPLPEQTLLALRAYWKAHRLVLCLRSCRKNFRSGRVTLKFFDSLLISSLYNSNSASFIVNLTTLSFSLFIVKVVLMIFQLS